MRLTHVRVPRDSLLRKTGQVSRDGTYTPPSKCVQLRWDEFSCHQSL